MTSLQCSLYFYSRKKKDIPVSIYSTFPSSVEPCGYTLYDASLGNGSLSTPYFDAGYDYADAENCVWEIRAEPGKRIKLQMAEWEVEAFFLTM